MLKNLSNAIGQFFRKLWLVPQTLANVSKDREKQTALNALEAERIDRIRNPSKYLGK